MPRFYKHLSASGPRGLEPTIYLVLGLGSLVISHYCSFFVSFLLFLFFFSFPLLPPKLKFIISHIPHAVYVYMHCPSHSL